MPSIDLYGVYMSPPCRAAMVTAKAVGVDVNVIETSPLNTRTPQFLAINPQHCIPTIKDGNFTLWESRAIMLYLAQKYGEKTELCPASPVERGKIDKMLYADMALWSKYLEYALPVVFRGAKPNPENLAKVHTSLGTFNDMMDSRSYATGSTVTVADHSLVVILTSIEAAGVDISKYENLVAYIERCKTWPYYDAAEKGLVDFGNFFKSKFEAALLIFNWAGTGELQIRGVRLSLVQGQ